MKHYNLVETAKIIRQTLKQTYPRTQFSVRSKSYSMGCSIDVSWTDGPTSKMVDDILNRFENRGFDGMTDCSYSLPDSMWNGEKCTFGANYVHSSRHISEVLLQIAAYRVHKETKLPLLEVKDGRYGNLQGGNYQTEFVYMRHCNPPTICHTSHGDGEYYERLVHQVSWAIATEQPVPSPATLPEYIVAKEERADDAAKAALEAVDLSKQAIQ